MNFPSSASTDNEKFIKLVQKSHEIIHPESKSNENKTKLHVAVEKNDISKVERYIKEGYDVNQVSKNNWSPLYLASCFGFINIIQLLFENGANINFNRNGEHGHTALLGCCQNISPLQTDIIKYLVNNGADYTTVEDLLFQTPLFYCCEIGNLQAAKFLITKGSNPNTCGINNISPLFISCQEGHIDIVRYLVEEALPKINIDIELNSSGTTPIQIACYRNHWDIVKYLISKSANINKKCVHPAHVSTCLHAAVIFGNEEVTQKLLDNYADVNALGPNDVGMTPTYAAFDRKNWKIAKMLLNTHNVDVNIGETKTNTSLLHSAIHAENLEMIDLLLELHADVNQVSLPYRSTPLHDAVHIHNLDIVKALIEKGDGLDILQENMNAFSALDIAKAKGYLEIYDYLCQKVCEKV